MGKRDVSYEFVRVVSMVLVIGIHSLATVPGTGPWEQWAGYCLSTLFLLCNGLFFMLSGRFALDCRCQGPGQLLRWYARRLLSTGLPVMLFMLLRTMHDSGWWPAYLRSPELWQDYRRNLLGGLASTEYWFLFPLMGLLAAAPFLGRAVRSLSDGELALLLVMGMGYNALTVYLPELGLPFLWQFPLGGWLVLFLLGYALERLVCDRRRRLVLILGLGCYVLTVLQQHMGFTPGIHDLAPAYVFMCAAAFLGLRAIYRPGPVRDKWILAVGKHSLTVYLCHGMILSQVSTQLPEMAFLPRLALTMAVTTAVSLAAAFVVDSLVLFPLQRLVQKHL